MVFARNTDTGVGYTDSDTLLVASDVDGDRSGRRILDSVFDQILDDLAQMIVIDISIKKWTDLFSAVFVLFIVRWAIYES